MLALNTFVAFFAFAAPLLVRADVTPTGPAPGDVFNQGSNCVITWSGDTNSTTNWKNMAIELMTGDNINMVHLTSNYLLYIYIYISALKHIIHLLHSRRHESRWYRQR